VSAYPISAFWIIKAALSVTVVPLSRRDARGVFFIDGARKARFAARGAYRSNSPVVPE